jgi:hypothetical protein
MSSFGFAVVSVFLIRLIGSYIDSLPIELFEKALSNNMYNFIIVQVSEISDFRIMTAANVIEGAFRNLFPAISVTIFITLYLRSELKNGGIRNIIMKGFSRHKILFSKFIIISFATSCILTIYFLGYLVAAPIVFGLDGLGVLDILKNTRLLFVEILLHIALASFCLATCMGIRKSSVLLFNAGIVVMGTQLINMISIFSADRISLYSYWIMFLTNSITLGSSLLWAVLIASSTIVVCYLVATQILRRAEFE